MHDYRSLPDFDSDLEQLRKKYPHVEDDIREALKLALAGKAPTYPIPLFPGLVKIRIASADQNRGKRGGFRVIYHSGVSGPCLISVYAKAQYEQLPIAELRRLAAKVAAYNKQGSK
ncbi:hypothetical protein ACG33_07185 [Steroidobacter denitrificans]|uniref:Uncharacterized protein n=1 Tax=Steroidobacter denitrificans TaxID=465721 RepID=A0A127F8Y4_STEDE|nr:hypothetical protein ACG33_07185 [Steroidobacter denitrificans]